MEVKQRKKRSDTGTRLTERDLLALRLIGEQYALRFDQLQALLGQHAQAPTRHSGSSQNRQPDTLWTDGNTPDSSSTKSSLQIARLLLVDHRRLTRRKLTLPHIRAFSLTGNHISLVAQARLYFASKHPECPGPVSDGSERNWTRRSKVVKLPDALLHLPDNRSIAIDGRAHSEKRHHLEQIIKDRALVYGQTWYFATAGAQKALHAAIHQLDDTYQQRVKIYSLDLLTRK